MRSGHNNTVDGSPRVSSSCERMKMGHTASQKEKGGFPALAVRYYKSLSLRNAQEKILFLQGTFQPLKMHRKHGLEIEKCYSCAILCLCDFFGVHECTYSPDKAVALYWVCMARFC